MCYCVFFFYFFFFIFFQILPFSFLGYTKWNSVQKISFEKLNGENGYVMKNPNMVKHYLESIHGLHFLFKQLNSDQNALLANLMLFSIESWSSEDLLDLKERDKIQSINEFLLKAYYFKYEIDTSQLSGSFFIDHLVRSLRYFQTKNNCVLPRLTKLSMIESPNLTIEEVTWLKNLKSRYFNDICQVVSADSEHIELFIGLEDGDLELRHRTMFMSFSLMKERFQRLIEEGLGLNINGINPMLYDLCVAITGARMEHLPSFEHKIHFFLQSPHLHHYPKILELSKSKSYLTAYKSELPSSLVKKQLDTEKKIASFVTNLEIYLLVILDSLLKFPMNPTYQQWQRDIKRLLFKYLKHLCGKNADVQQLYNDFGNNISQLVAMIQRTIQEGNNDPDEV